MSPSSSFLVKGVCLNLFDVIIVPPPSAISSGFVPEQNRAFLLFVDERTSSDGEFDWGEAALQAIREWHQKGMGGGKSFDLTWPDDKRVDLT